MKTFYVLLVAVGVVASVSHVSGRGLPFDRTAHDNDDAGLPDARMQELLDKALKKDPDQFKAFLDMRTLHGHGLTSSRWMRQPMPMNEYIFLSTLYPTMTKEEALANFFEEDGRWGRAKAKVKTALYEATSTAHAWFMPDEEKLQNFYAKQPPSDNVEEDEDMEFVHMRQRLEALMHGDSIVSPSG